MSKVLQIYQFSDAYCYNSDSLFLWDFAREYIKNGMSILDICSGSGILGLLCARGRDLDLTQVEIQREFAFINRQNALVNKIRSEVINVDFKEFKSENKFDIIISNPPFYPIAHKQKENLSKNISVSSAFLPLRDLIFGAKRLLKPHARFIFCYHSVELDSIFLYLNQAKLNICSICFVYPRISSNSKLVLISSRLNSNESTLILPPLITHTGINQGDNSAQVVQIYKNANTHSIKVRLSDLDFTK